MDSNNDSPGSMCLLGPVFNIVIAKQALGARDLSVNKTFREILEAELQSLATGFTVFEVVGNWHGDPEASVFYIVSLPQIFTNRLLHFLGSFRSTIGENAIFLSVSGLGLLLGPEIDLLVGGGIHHADAA